VTNKIHQRKINIVWKEKKLKTGGLRQKVKLGEIYHKASTSTRYKNTVNDLDDLLEDEHQVCSANQASCSSSTKNYD
jgi:hypothetical protein